MNAVCGYSVADCPIAGEKGAPGDTVVACTDCRADYSFPCFTAPEGCRENPTKGQFDVKCNSDGTTKNYTRYFCCLDTR